ncbi:MAG: TylF/MycF family methyltransferase [Deltaproteobacteria bacterium]|nr:TylF/MycF family methyltransferase [Deltaproteobacteria bacterium]
MKNRLVKFLWKDYKNHLLNLKGFKNHHLHCEKEFLDLYIAIYSERKALLGIRDMYNIFKLVQVVRHIDGDIAEVGVYKGGSAKIICEAKGNKKLHLFDTFEGMPAAEKDIDLHGEGDFSNTKLEDVKRYLKNYPDVYFYPGIFPDSATDPGFGFTRFSFVNLDVDIFQSTLRALEYFYPKMARGGIILSHDYNSLVCPGVRKAYGIYFHDKPEPVIELWDSQCIMIKQ